MKALRAVLAIIVILFSACTPAADFDCLIEPLQTVEIRSPVAGLIEKVFVGRGDQVTKGKVLVTLQSSVERSASELARFKSQMQGPIRSGESRVTFAERKFVRKKDLGQQEYIPMQERDEAEGELELANAELMLAYENKQLARLEYLLSTAQLNLRTLRSPFNGVVVDQMLYPGEMVEVGDGRKPVLKLAQLDPLRIDAILPIAMYGHIKPGMRAKIFPEAPVGGQYATTVKVVDRVVDAASGTFGVRMELGNTDNRLPGGIKCKVQFPDSKNLPPLSK